MTRGNRQSVTVLGDGGWGTTLAIHLVRHGHAVRVWGAFPSYVRELARRRVNPKFLPGVAIPSAVRFCAQLEEAVTGADTLVVAVPSQYVRSVVRGIAPATVRQATVVSVVKGLERHTTLRMSQVLERTLHPRRLVVLSGPSIASEVASGRPCSLVAASRHAQAARQVQRLFAGPAMRLYTSSDVAGVELGGALKNPIAIAAGIADGLALGTNAKAALMTRGLVELTRLGVAMGGRPQTFWGLSGLGDLLTTCMSPLSRNRSLGEQLGRGRRLRQILGSTEMVVEGVETVRVALELGRQHRVELPIMREVERVLFHAKSPRQAVQDLMTRAFKAE
ncbi:MAG: NAD(P)-dependent glycerol-3-phosphate dehydrogenase [Candidatus Omnitrophica bacterium]|nr:NAD(P)-dependent glycerol-3-phosphate dehydrogenase [Candidatus Omnitrophota bacterium]